MEAIMEKAWRELNPDTAKFILGQLEKKLEATIETANILSGRAVSILQFSIPILVALVGVIVSKPPVALIHLSVIGVLILAIVSWKALKLNELYEIYPLGNSLEKLLSDEKLSMKEYQEFAFIYNSIRTTHEMIVFNENSNRQRQKHVSFIISTIKVGCIVVVCYAALWFTVFQFLLQ